MTLQDLRNLAQNCLSAALDAVEPGAAVRAHLQRDGDDLIVAGERLGGFGSRRCWVVGAGKASAPMAAAVVDVCGDAVAGGVVVVKDECAQPVAGVEVYEAAHPVPDERGATATRHLAEIVAHAELDDVVIACWSGGASSLLAEPAPGISLSDYQRTTELLLASGLDIHAANTIRKHLSATTGGQLGASCRAPIVALVVSDVIGDDPAVIGSGPTSPDASTFDEALAIAQQTGLWDALPTSVRERLTAGAAGQIEETPEDAVLGHCQNVVVASNYLALVAAGIIAREAGYDPDLRSEWLYGEAAERARDFVASEGLCVIAGGETTVTLGETFGQGGRNQEFALASAAELDGINSVVVLSAGTDGTDGPNDAAGGLVDGGTWRRIAATGLDSQQHLAGHNAYPALEAAGDLLRTGPTRTNVMDIAILLRARE